MPPSEPIWKKEPEGEFMHRKETTMTVRELYAILNEKIPPSLSCPWDNDGLMCCSDGKREVKRVLVTLDVTEAAIGYAKENGFDLIVSHHPMLFKGLKSVNGESYLGKKTVELLLAGISVMCFHTRLDAVEGGVNDTLCDLLGIENVEAFGDEGIGRIGALPTPMSAEDFARLVKERLGAPAVFLGDAGLPVCRVAVLGGSGGDDIGAAREAGADTYLSGNLGYHDMTDAPEAGMNLLEAGHFFTEQPVTATLEEWLYEIDATLSVEQFYSNTVKTV